MIQYAVVDMLPDACFDEFCGAIGDSHVGCDICPYQEVEYGECRKAYKKDKLDRLRGENE